LREIAVIVLVAACGRPAPHEPATSHVTRVHVRKGAHVLELLDQDRVVRSYTVAIGRGGLGPKRQEGDGVTPTGQYTLAAPLSSAKFHRFIPVSYPNEEDKKRFAALKGTGGLAPDATIGDGIGIHGVGDTWLAPFHKLRDWTRGCIAVDNDEIDEIASLVRAGTPIQIED
jgi:murein L,D-transpeptidase YafK